MLTRNASPALRAWKYGLTLPVLVFLFLFACQKPASEQSENGPLQTGERTLSDVSVAALDLFEVDNPPQFPGGQAALKQFLSENIKFPEAARNESAEGLVAVTFVVDENGTVKDVEGIKMNQNGWRQDFQDEAIRVVQSMPKWEPATKSGKAISVKFTLPVKFKLR
jgi:TonB family protein